MSYVGELRARLGLDARPFDRGLNRSRASAGVFARKVRGLMAGVGVSIAGALSVRAVRGALDSVDAQAKLARSLGTTTESVQILTRASDLSGVSLGEMQQATLQMTKRLSQAAAGGGPAAKALQQIGLSAQELVELPLDQRLAKIQDAIAATVPEAQRAAVATRIFGDRAGLVFTRIDSATLRQATADVRDFGVAVSDQDASQIETTNDALSRLGLIAKGTGNQIAAAIAPAAERAANGLAAIVREGNPVRATFEAISNGVTVLRGNLDILSSVLVGLAAVKAVNFVTALGGVQSALLAVASAARTAATAVWIAAGPWGILAGLVAGAAAYFLVFRDNTATSKTAMAEAKDAQAALNASMGVFYETAAPNAAQAALDAAQKYREKALAAREAARANLAMLKSELAMQQGINSGLQFGNFFGADEERIILEDLAAARAELAEAEEMLADAERKRKRTATAITGAMSDQIAKTQELNNQVNVTVESLSKLGSGGGKAAEDTDKLGEAITGLRDPVTEVEGSFRSAFRSAVTGAGSLNDVLSTLLGRMADIAANSAFDILFGAPGSARSTNIFGAIVSALIPGYAGGTDSHPGGLAWVGETGRELVNLPRGSQVIPHARSERMVSGGGLDVRVFVDQDGNWQAAVERISGQVTQAAVQQSAPAIVASAVKTVSRKSHQTKQFMGY